MNNFPTAEMDRFDENLSSVFSDRHSGSVTVLNKLIQVSGSYILRETDDMERLLVLQTRLKLIRQTLGYFSAVNHFVDYLEDEVLRIENEPGKAKDYLTGCIIRYHESWKNANREMAEVAIDHLELENGVVLLHSQSSAVITFFSVLKEQNIRMKVFQTESRPGNEGILQAEAIAGMGFEVVLIVDAAITMVMNEIDLAITGADQVYRDCFINKIGTSSIAFFCSQSRVPFYVFADSRKIKPETDGFQRYTRFAGDPDEILTTHDPLITPVNYYFEPINISLVSAILTEKAMILPGQF